MMSIILEINEQLILNELIVTDNKQNKLKIYKLLTLSIGYSAFFSSSLYFLAPLFFASSLFLFMVQNSNIQKHASLVIVILFLLLTNNIHILKQNLPHGNINE